MSGSSEPVDFCAICFLPSKGSDVEVMGSKSRQVHPGRTQAVLN